MVLEQIQEPIRNESVLVGLTSTQVAQFRNQLNKRKVILIRNISPNLADEISINLGMTQATADTGIILKQNESFSDSNSAGYECFQGTITAICLTANGKVAILER